MTPRSFFQDLSPTEMAEIRAHGSSTRVPEGDLLFAEGDPVGSFFIIESGRISIFVTKLANKEVVCTLGAGQYFGEMAIFSRDKRSASALALEDTELLTIDKDWFLQFVDAHPHIAEHINAVLTTRKEELILKENLLKSTGIDSDRLHVSIKGDPSLRESAFTRERYESMVDKILEPLEPVLEALLTEHCVYRLFINFNSGEVRTSSILDPFNEKIHTADKLVLKNYVERHFPVISYDEKCEIVRDLQGVIRKHRYFDQLPEHWKHLLTDSHKRWQPVPREEISAVMSKLTVLRNMPNFYLRNISVSMITDTIRMQFNCDGTHIVNAVDYQRFLVENVME
jgi:CRP-like cAMP-binding protein